jgi:hypothetical protein
METETFYFWSFCIVSLFLGKAVSSYLIPDSEKFLKAYGGYESDENDYIKID